MLKKMKYLNVLLILSICIGLGGQNLFSINLLSENNPNIQKQDALLLENTVDSPTKDISTKGWGDDYDYTDDAWLNDADGDNLLSMPMNQATNSFFVYLEQGDTFYMQASREFETSQSRSENVGWQMYDPNAVQVAGTEFSEFNNATILDDVTYDLFDYTALETGVYRVDTQGTDPNNPATNSIDGSYNVEFGTLHDSQYYYHNMWFKMLNLYSPCAMGALCNPVYNATSFSSTTFSISGDGVVTEWEILEDGGQVHKLYWSTRGLVDKETCEAAPVSSISIGEQFVPFSESQKCLEQAGLDATTNTFLMNPQDPTNKANFALPESFESEVYDSYVSPIYKEIEIKVASAKYSEELGLVLEIEGLNLNESFVDIVGTLTYANAETLDFTVPAFFDEDGKTSIAIKDVDVTKLNEAATINISVEDFNSHYLVLTDIERMGDINVDNITFEDDILYYDESYLYESEFCTDDVSLPFLPADEGKMIDASTGISSSQVTFGWSYPDSTGLSENCIGRTTFDPSDGDAMVIRENSANVVLDPVAHNNGAYSSIWTSNATTSSIYENIPVAIDPIFEASKSSDVSVVKNDDSIVYTLEVENHGGSGTVEIKDDMSDNEFTEGLITDITITGTGVTPTTISVSQLQQGVDVFIPAGETATIKYTYTLPEEGVSDINTDFFIYNTLEINPDPDGDGFGTCLNDLCSDNNEVEYNKEYPTIELLKTMTESTDTNSTIQVNEVVTYTLDVTNTSTIIANDVIVKDELTEISLAGGKFDVSNVDAKINDVVVATGDLQQGITIPVLLPNETATVSFEVTYDENSNIVDGQTISNIASAEIGNCSLVNRQECFVSSDVDSIIELPTATVNKTVVGNPSPVLPGSTLTYQFDVTNTSNLDITSLQLLDVFTDTVFKGSEITSTIVNPSTALVEDNSVTNPLLGSPTLDLLLDVAAGETVSVLVDIKLSDTEIKDGTAVTNLGFIDIPGDKNSPLDPNNLPVCNKALINDSQLCDSEYIQAVEPTIEMLKTVEDADGDDFAEPGETLTYTITVTNTGLINAYDVIVIDEMTELILANATIDEDSLSVVTTNKDLDETVVDVTGQDITQGVVIPVIEVDGFATVSIDVVMPNSIQTDLELDNTASAQIGNCTVTANEDCTVEDDVTVITGYEDLVITKTHTPTDFSLVENGKLDYEISIVNNGTSVANTVRVVDEFNDAAFDGATIEAIQVAPIDSEIVDNSVLQNDIKLDLSNITVNPGQEVLVTVSVLFADELSVYEGTAVNNTALIDQTPDNPNDELICDVDTTLCDEDTVDPKSSFVTIAKSVTESNDSNTTVQLNEDVNYKLEISNNSDMAEFDVLVVDTLEEIALAGGNFDVSNVDATIDSKVVATGDLITGITIPVINPGEVAVIEFTVTYDENSNITDGQTISNSASVANENCSLVNREECISNDDVTTTIELPTAIVNKSVVGNPEPILAGETLTYQFDVTNTSNMDIVGLQLLDVFSDVVFKGSEITNITVNPTTALVEDNSITNPMSGTLTLDLVLDVAAGQTVTVLVDIKLSDTEIRDGMTVVNLGFIDVPNDTNPPLDTNNLPVCSKAISEDVALCDTAYIQGSEPVIDLTKSVVDTDLDNVAEPGETLTYTIDVVNVGDVSAYDVLVVDEMTELLEVGATINNDSLSVSITDKDGQISNVEVQGNDITKGIQIPVIEVGATATVSIDVVLPNTTPLMLDTLTNKVTASADNCTIDCLVEDEVDIITGFNNLVITKAHTPTDFMLVENGKLDCTITVENLGTSIANDVRIVDEFNDAAFDGAVIENILVESVDKDFTDNSSVDKDILLDISELDVNPGEVVTITVSVLFADQLSVNDGSIVINQAVIDQTPLDPNDPIICELASTLCSEDVIDPKYPTLEVEKLVTDETQDNLASANETISYQILTSNVSDVTAYDVVVKDDMAQLATYGYKPSNVLAYNDANLNSTYDKGEDTYKGDITTGITVDEINPGEVVIVEFDVKLDDKLTAGSSLYNIASSTPSNHNPNDPNLGKVTDDVIIDVDDVIVVSELEDTGIVSLVGIMSMLVISIMSLYLVKKNR